MNSSEQPMLVCLFLFDRAPFLYLTYLDKIKDKTVDWWNHTVPEPLGRPHINYFVTERASHLNVRLFILRCLWLDSSLSKTISLYILQVFDGWNRWCFERRLYEVNIVCKERPLRFAHIDFSFSCVRAALKGTLSFSTNVVLLVVLLGTH